MDGDSRLSVGLGTLTAVFSTYSASTHSPSAFADTYATTVATDLVQCTPAETSPSSSDLFGSATLLLESLHRVVNRAMETHHRD